MLKVLGWLAISMTVGSFVLSWLEPEPAPPGVSLSDREPAERARLAVNSRQSPIRFWRAIEIVPLAALADRRGIPLTATRNLSDVHFAVTGSGEILAGASWRHQSLLAGTDGIRIGLEADHRIDGRPPAAQSSALSALLDALKATMSTNHEKSVLPIILTGWDQARPSLTWLIKSG